jgi:thiol-disulfide isomerase/thioredoxin
MKNNLITLNPMENNLTMKMTNSRTMHRFMYRCLTLVAAAAVLTNAVIAAAAAEGNLPAVPIQAVPLRKPDGTSAAAGSDNKRVVSHRKLQELHALVEKKEEGSEEKLEEFLSELDTDKDLKALSSQYRFRRFLSAADKKLDTEQGIAEFKAGIKEWLDRQTVSEIYILHSALRIVQDELVLKENKPDEQEKFVKEFTEFVNAPERKLTDPIRKRLTGLLEASLRFGVGKDLKLYGKTLDDKDFQWEDLRGKYVLVKFTATWCGPCKGEIPGLLSAYKQYKDKGFEIVSVYLWERGADAQENAERVRTFSEKEGLTWRILSEALTEKAGLPKQGEFYGITGVPTMVLIDKEGKIIDAEARGEKLQKKLAVLFGEKETAPADGSKPEKSETAQHHRR